MKQFFLGVLAWIAPACASSLPQGSLDSSEVSSLDAFPFDRFDAVVRARVNDSGKVDYAALADDDAALVEFTAAVASVGPRTRPELFPSNEARFAYWIDAYNALAMLNALTRYPGLTNVGDVKADFFYFTNVRVDGEKTNLYDFENELIRPKMRAVYLEKNEGSKLGRIHFALNCASESCPRLPNEAFTPEALEAQLDRETREFVADPRNVSVDAGAKKVTVSRLFDWYAEDFTSDDGTPIPALRWINRYRAEDAQIDESLAVDFFEYDWTLNAQKGNQG